MARHNTIRTIEQAEAALLPYVPLVATLIGKDLTLSRIRPLMKHIGDPQDKIRVVHIAGTSGKTSTAYYIARLLQGAGKKIGLTVSPHVDSITERVQIDGQPITEEKFCSELQTYLDLLKDFPIMLSYFELLYAFAIWVFERAGVDYAVVETGLGGLHDATNIIDRADKVCVITDIGFDHMQILGYTLPEIAAQKIGIVHEGNQIIMYEQGREVMDVVHAWAKTHHAPLLALNETEERADSNASLAAMPAYQQRNWLLAHHVFEFVRSRDGLNKLSADWLIESQQLQVPGRMDSRKVANKTLVMDGAHNSQKMTAFIASFQGLFPGTKPTVLLALKQGKEYEEVAKLLANFTDSVIVTTITASQDLPITSIDPENLATALRSAGISKVQVIVDHESAFQALLNQPGDVAVITGSFYLLSQLRREESLL